MKKKNVITFSLVKYEHTCLKINNTKCWECNNVKLLEIDKDSNLKFNKYVSSICTKAGRTLSTLRRTIFVILNFYENILLINLQFNYCRIVWMCLGDLSMLISIGLYVFNVVCAARLAKCRIALVS